MTPELGTGKLAGIEQEVDMKTYVILRRGGWRSPADLEQAAARSRQVGDEEMSDDIRWIRSYVMAEEDGGLGTVCIYQASSPEKIRSSVCSARSSRKPAS